MSYGNGKSSKTHDFRALPLAVGVLNATKKDALAVLLAGCLTTLRQMGEAVACHEPLLGTATSEEITQRLLVVQKSIVGLNKAYAERCRIAVTAAVSEQNSRYFSQLIGRLRHAVAEIPVGDQRPDAEGAVRQYYYVPPGTTISPEALTALALMGEQSFSEVKALFVRVVLQQDETDVTPEQAVVIREIHRQVQGKHGTATFGAETITVSLPLQYTVLPSCDKDIASRIDAGMETLLLSDLPNTKYRFFLDISSPIARQARIRLPLSVPRRTLRHLLREGVKDFAANSLTLELGPDGAVGVRLVVTQPKQAPTPLTDIAYLLSRDFGYKNTISLSLTRLDVAITAEQIEAIQSFTKEQAQQFLSTHALATDLHVAARYRFSGKHFLEKINALSLRIDALRANIDNEYRVLNAEKVALTAGFGHTADAQGHTPLLTKDDAKKGHPLFAPLRVFLARLGRIGCLKKNQRALYKKIQSIKRHWFGFLSNIEAGVARQWKALVVREHLTNVTEEKAGPGYKGRAFNKMLNAGSRGQYVRRASDKLRWNGVPEVALPSYYTSTTCTRHAVVNKRQRRGDVFACVRCLAEGRPREHADDHAADTLGAYLQLRPIK